jgi:hypothetical protein
MTSSIRYVDGIPYLKELPKSKIETFILAQDTHINPKMIVLTPGDGYSVYGAGSVQMIAEGAGVQLSGRDFTVTDTVVSWSGSPLELVFSAGDIVQIIYTVISV